jgi:hypothetical protein
MIKAKMDAKGIEYKEETNIDALIEQGFMCAPVLDIDGRYISSFKEENDWVNSYGGDQ